MSVGMILLISSLANAHRLARTLEDATSNKVQVCTTFAEATSQMQAQEFSAVIIDQLLLDVDPDGAETASAHFGTAVPVYLNFALNGVNRVVRELQSALKRRQRETLTAKKYAEQVFRHELSETVTALLLSCELALQVPGLPTMAAAKMHAVDALAKEVSAKLGAMA
jgi:hypothetical protein